MCMDVYLDQLIDYLHTTGKKQYQLAAEIGAPTPTVSRWFNRKGNISPSYRRIMFEKGILTKVTKAKGKQAS